MSVQFEVEFTSKLPIAKQWVIDGWVKEGTVLQGDELIVESLGKEITVKSIALVNTPKHEEGRLTISIEEPGFDFDLIAKGMIIRNK